MRAQSRGGATARRVDRAAGKSVVAVTGLPPKSTPSATGMPRLTWLPADCWLHLQGSCREDDIPGRCFALFPRTL